MELNPFLSCASTLSSRSKGCISFLLLLDLELANVIQDFRSALTLKSPLISTVDIVMIMTSTLLLMCQSLLWHFHASSAFSVTFWTACNSSKSEIFRNKSFRLSNLKISITHVSRNINSEVRTVDPHCPRLQYLLTHLTTHFLPCDSILGISLMIKTTSKYFRPLLTLPYT